AGDVAVVAEFIAAAPATSRSLLCHHSNWACVLPPLGSLTVALRVRPLAVPRRGRASVSPADEVEGHADGGPVVGPVGAWESRVKTHGGPQALGTIPLVPWTCQEYVPPSGRSESGIVADKVCPDWTGPTVFDPSTAPP